MEVRECSLCFHDGRWRSKGPIESSDNAPAQVVEHIQIKEMHHSQHHKHQPDLVADQFNCLACIDDGGGCLQSQRNIADVDQIKADHQQMIHGIGQLHILVK